MSAYDVEWLPPAENQLTNIWLGSADRPAVNAAQVIADRLLARDPHANGTHVSEGLYQINCPPLAISMDELDELMSTLEAAIDAATKQN